MSALPTSDRTSDRDDDPGGADPRDDDRGAEPSGVQELDDAKKDPASPTEKKRHIRRFLKRTFATLALLLVSALALGQTDWGEAKIAALAEEAIASELGLDAALGKVEVSYGLLPPAIRVEAREITIDHPEHGRLATARSLSLRPALLPLFWGALDLQDILLEEPAITLLIQDGRVINIPVIEPSPGPEEPITLPFSRFEIRQGEVHVEMRSTELPETLEAALSGVDLRVDVHTSLRSLASAGGSALSAELDCRRGRIQHPGGEERLTRLLFEGDVDLQQAQLEVDRFLLETDQTRVALSDARGSFDPELPYAGHVELRVDLAQLARLPIEITLPPFAGELELNADVEGAGIAVAGEGTLTIRGGLIEDRWGLGDQISLNLRANTEQITIEEGSLAQLRHGGTVGLRGALQLDPEAGFPVQVQTQIRDLNLSKLLSQLGVTEDAIVDWPMNGTADLSGTLSPPLLSGPVHITTRDFFIGLNAWHERPRRRVMGVTRGDLRGRWRINSDAVSFFDIELNTPGSRVRASQVHLGFDNHVVVDAAGTIDLRDLSPLVEFSLAGSADARVRVRGEFDSPIVTGEVAVRDFEFDGFRLGDVETDFRIRDDHNAVLFPNLRATKGSTQYRVDDLLLDFATGGVEVHGDLRTGRALLSDVYHVFGYENDERYAPFQGIGRGHMRIDYRYGQPGTGPTGTLRSAIEIEIQQAELATQRFEGGRFAGTLVWTDFTRGLDAATLAIDELQLSKGEATLVVEGEITPEGPEGQEVATPNLRVRADQLALAELQGLEDAGPIDGHVSLIGEVHGTLALPRVLLDVNVSGARMGELEIGDARAYVRLTDVDDPWVQEARDWDVEALPDQACAHARFGLAHGRWPASPPVITRDGPVPALDKRMAFLICGEGMNGHLRADLALGWTDVYPARGVIDLDALPLEDLLGPQQSALGIAGSISGRLALNRGALLRPGSLGGWVHIPQLAIRAQGGPAATRGDAAQRAVLALQNRGVIGLTIESGGFHIDQAQIVAANSAHMNSGEVSMMELSGGGDARGRLHMALAGDLDLAILESLALPIDEAEGRLRAEMEIRGTLQDPTAFGRVSLEGASVRSALLPSPIEEIHGSVRFDAHRAEIQELSARFAGGEIAAVGSARLDQGQLREYNAQVGLRDALIEPMDGVHVVSSADLRLSWREGDALPLLGGEVRIIRAMYERDTSLSPTLGELNTPQRERVQSYDPSADHVRLDIEIIDRAPLMIRNNLLNLDIGIDDEASLRLVGTDQRVGLVGMLTIPRGTFRFRNTDFNVTRGEIRFEDEERIDPIFDVRTETEIRRQQTSADLTAQAWRVQLHAHGTLDHFRLDATSRPSLSEEDLMLLLTVGMTSAEAQQLRASDVGGTALEALSAISGVNDEVRDAVRIIDDFAITTQYSRVTGRPEPMVTIGKRITDRIRLNAATGLSGEERSVRTGVEWQVGDRTSFQVLYDNINRESSSSFGNVGLDFHWRLEFE